MRNSELHKGHRQRLKDKVRTNGLKSLSTHEVLELLLTYTIPYKDTNELAHQLIKTYGSFANVLNANFEDLMLVNGVGKETALFLTMLPQYFDIYKLSLPNKNRVLNNVMACVKFFYDEINLSNIEKSYLVLTNNDNEVLKTIEMSEGDEYKTSFMRDKLSKVLATIKCKNIIIFHTHPNGRAEPSVEDFNATKSILGICKLVGVELMDHIIINSCEYYSFRSHNVLQELNLDVNKKLHELLDGSSIMFNKNKK